MIDIGLVVEQHVRRDGLAAINAHAVFRFGVEFFPKLQAQAIIACIRLLVGFGKLLAAPLRLLRVEADDPVDLVALFFVQLEFAPDLDGDAVRFPVLFDERVDGPAQLVERDMDRRIGDAALHLVPMRIVFRRLAAGARRDVALQHLLVFRQSIGALAAGVGLGIGPAVNTDGGGGLGDDKAVPVNLVLHGVGQGCERGRTEPPEAVRHRRPGHRPGMGLVQTGLGFQPAHKVRVVLRRALLFGDLGLPLDRQVRPPVPEAFRPRHPEIDHIAVQIAAVAGLLVEAHLLAQLQNLPQFRERHLALFVQVRAQGRDERIALVRRQLAVLLVLADDLEFVHLF